MIIANDRQELIQYMDTHPDQSARVRQLLEDPLLPFPVHLVDPEDVVLPRRLGRRPKRPSIQTVENNQGLAIMNSFVNMSSASCFMAPIVVPGKWDYGNSM